MYLEMVVAWVALGALEFWKCYGEALRVIKPNQMKYHWLRHDFFCNYRSGHDKTQKLLSKYNYWTPNSKVYSQNSLHNCSNIIIIVSFPHHIRDCWHHEHETHIWHPPITTVGGLEPPEPKPPVNLLSRQAVESRSIKGPFSVQARVGRMVEMSWGFFICFLFFFGRVRLGCNKSQFKVWSGEVMIGWMGWMIFVEWFNLNLFEYVCFSSSLNHFYPELCLHPIGLVNSGRKVSWVSSSGRAYNNASRPSLRLEGQQLWSEIKYDRTCRHQDIGRKLYLSTQVPLLSSHSHDFFDVLLKVVCVYTEYLVSHVCLDDWSTFGLTLGWLSPKWCFMPWETLPNYTVNTCHYQPSFSINS